MTTDTEMPSEAPQIAQDATEGEDQYPTATPVDLNHLADLVGQKMAATGGLSVQEHLLILERWLTFAFYGLGAAIAEVGMAAGLPIESAQVEAASLIEQLTATRLNITLDYLESRSPLLVASSTPPSPPT